MGTQGKFPAELISYLRVAQKAVVLTGAGVSAESGVPTFRDAATGLWAKYDPQKLATPDAFRQNPRLVWEWYAWRRDLVSQVKPNPAHFALVEMEKHIPEFQLEHHIIHLLDCLRRWSQAVILQTVKRRIRQVINID